ncbi:spore germination protein (amino acid permease) [Halobacillus alkaliphilus]|uniref:Spore germination protein (Amino acid permease) n=1 Tax=Halobacillus alkaliphilus TaxID=396056 RepID=A0A1I2QNX9_9BACI|nr:GerAB/ArcD/ProY family transporter [Halobacillus alkaliphilus]SFG27376.1 spore germination protein (amino acid permease) [Halobacillus alkaliphilus]
MSKTTIKTKLSRRQYFFIIVQTEIGVGILSLPYDLHSQAKQDGWISLLIGGVLLQIVLLVIWLIAKRYPDKDFFQINEAVFSKWIGKGISLLYIAYFSMVSMVLLLLFVRLISLWVLPQTPFWILSLLMILVCLYLASGGINVMARFYTFVSVLLIVLLGFVVYSLKDSQIVFLFPILNDGWVPVIKGANEAVLSFFGFIISLVIYSKVEGSPAQRLRTIFYAHWFVVLFYLFTVITSFTFFSTVEMSFIQEPLLYMLKSFDFTIVARLDLFFLSIWVVNVATTLTTYVYMTGLGLTDVFGTKKTTPSYIIAAFIILVPPLFIGYNMERVDQFNNFVVWMGYIFSVAFLFIIYFISLIRGSLQKGGAS